ncbi:MAG: antibiotic biosynthesis monooxygenase [Actinomycetota bacterium]|nr:antibiotic biosynthesis monooxygenase [Actinomycetota bacterium]
MHARVSTYVGSADHVEDAIRSFEEISAAVRELDGFEGAYLLVDRGNGRALTITLWSSEDAVQASTGRADQTRAEAAATAGISIESVEVYEVASQLSPPR